jgi:tRNA pseudouridine55 synthase
VSLSIVKQANVSGLLVVDKPLRMTSRDAVNMAWRWLPRGTRIGHTGTLDPLASGVLVICAGQATRLAEYVQRMEKVYSAGIRLGARSTTDDGEGTIVTQPPDDIPSLEHVTAAIQEFLGTIAQIPPAHSASKVGGRRAYSLARRGQETGLAARPVTIHAVQIVHYDFPRLEIEVRCGKGTYIRALARDLGEALGCGAYLESLRRTRVGPFLADEALSLQADAEAARRCLLPLTAALRELPCLVLPDEQIAHLQSGRGVPVPVGTGKCDEIAILSGTESTLVVAQFDALRNLLMPKKVLAI